MIIGQIRDKKYDKKGLSKKATCLRGRVAAWPKLISAKMSTIVYDGGRSRKLLQQYFLGIWLLTVILLMISQRGWNVSWLHNNRKDQYLH